MPRRGLCRCGTVLVFESGPTGYKTRCPTCGSVVRLRADLPPASDEARQRQRSGVLAFRQPAPSDPETPSGESPPICPEQYNYDALRPGELPVVELVPLSELTPAPQSRSHWRTWLLLTAAVLAAAAAIVAYFQLHGT